MLCCHWSDDNDNQDSNSPTWDSTNSNKCTKMFPNNKNARCGTWFIVQSLLYEDTLDLVDLYQRTWVVGLQMIGNTRMKWHFDLGSAHNMEEVSLFYFSVFLNRNFQENVKIQVFIFQLNGLLFNFQVSFSY